MNKGFVAGAGAVTLLAVGATAIFLSSTSAPDVGAGTASSLPNANNVPANAQMQPVSPVEANKRATVNSQAAAAAIEEGKSFQSPTVISQVAAPDVGELPPEPPPKPEVRIIKEITEKVEQRTVYITPKHISQPIDDGAMRAAIQAQLGALVGGGEAASESIMAAQFYQEPPPPPEPQEIVRTVSAPPPQNSVVAPKPTAEIKPQKQIMYLRTGDVIYARLDRSFNSDDPAAPIIVSVDDLIYDGGTRPKNGPLTGMRLVGSISYSGTQSAIVFSQIVTISGRTYPVEAIAISEQNARTGIATNVDRHILERYSGLLIGSLLQGASTVADTLVQGNKTVAVADGVITTGNQKVNWPQVGVASLKPLGENLAQVATQNFSRPPTFSAKAGTGVGVVFLQPLVIPEGVK
jgi:Bacterial conjugation TrbI-like protein